MEFAQRVATETQWPGYFAGTTHFFFESVWPAERSA